MRVDARQLMIDHWSSIRAGLSRHKKLGVHVFAFDREAEPIGENWIEATVDKTRAAILGRHSSCNLLIPSTHPSVSLRHLAILVRATSNTDVRVRVIDLHTGNGFVDEAGRELEAVVSDGPMFFGVQDVQLAIFVTEDTELPESAEDAYAAIPERIFREEREGYYAAARRGHSLRGSAVVHREPVEQERRRGETTVCSVAGAVAASTPLWRDDEIIAGRLVLEARGMVVERLVGPSSLERGILIGRYSRCDVRTGADSERISRVHLLVVKEGDQVVAIDTASSNGTNRGEDPIYAAAIEPGDRLDLAAPDGLRLTWKDPPDAS